jgi:hypothetical protein
MSQENKTPSWWQTMLGFLTRIAAIITALAGMTGVLYQNGVLGGKEKSSLQGQTSQSGCWSCAQRFRLVTAGGCVYCSNATIVSANSRPQRTGFLSQLSPGRAF